MSDHMVVGLGQIGEPLREILGAHGHDVVPGKASWLPAAPPHISMLHICIPFSDDFLGQVIGYIREYYPAFCIIHSTVAPGTTQILHHRVLALGAYKTRVAYSPVRGRHGKMEEDLLYFTKYVAGFDEEAERAVAGALAAAGMRVQIAPEVEALELAKLLQTSFTGLLVAWAQEVDRLCGELLVSYDDACELFREMPNLPHVLHMPGFIGGHCIMANIDLLNLVRPSPLLSAVALSNQQWELTHGQDDERVWPKPWRQYA